MWQLPANSQEVLQAVSLGVVEDLAQRKEARVNKTLNNCLLI